MDDPRTLRRRKVAVALGALLLCTLVIVAVRRGGRPVAGNIAGIPVYPEAELNRQMTHTADPWMLVFLTRDDAQRAVDFYTEKLGVHPRLLTYGKGQMRLWQFNLEREEDARTRIRIGGSLLRNSVYRGVEVIPLNSIYRRAYGRSTKIKIILPPGEVSAEVRALIYPGRPSESEK